MSTPPIDRVRHNVKLAGGGSFSEERHSLAAEILKMDKPPMKKHVQRVFGEIFPHSTSFEERRLDPYVRRIPPLVGKHLSTSSLICA
jgi:hypothetical protein